MRRKTEERIVKIKTDTEELDKNRRTLEDKNKKERANKIQNEVIQSHKKNVEIDWNWQELEEKEDCKELAEVSSEPLALRLKIEPLPRTWLFLMKRMKINTILLILNRTSRHRRLHAPRSSPINRS